MFFSLMTSLLTVAMRQFLEQGKRITSHQIRIWCIAPYEREKDSYLQKKKKEVVHILRYIVPNFQWDKK